MKIHVECNADVRLVMTLGFTRKQIGHEGCIGNVLRKLEAANSGLAIIDEDPKSSRPGNAAHYRTQREEHGILFKAHTRHTGKKLAVLRPRLEEWLYSRAFEAGISPAKFRLPEQAALLKRFKGLEDKPAFREFLSMLAEQSAGVRTLGDWLRENMSGAGG